jgi:hypothetical protein
MKNIENKGKDERDDIRRRAESIPAKSAKGRRRRSVRVCRGR